MRAYSYACSLPITRQRWRYTIRSAVPENPLLHTNIKALCVIERELLLIKVLHFGNSNFWRFWFLWPWPWPNNLHIRTRPVVRRRISHLQIWTSYVKAFESNRLTDIQSTDTQTETTKIIPRRFAGGQKYDNVTDTVVIDCGSPFSSDRQHLSYAGSLEVRGEIIRTVLCCIAVLCTEVVHSHKHT